LSIRPSAQAVPNPDTGLLPGYICPHAYSSFIWPDASHCGRRFIFRKSYEEHWLEEHARASGGPINAGQTILVSDDAFCPVPWPRGMGKDTTAAFERAQQRLRDSMEEFSRTIPTAAIEWDDDVLIDLVVSRANTVPGWALGPACEHPHHVEHNLMCIVLEDARHLPRKDT
jgi:hypothetical protein